MSQPTPATTADDRAAFAAAMAFGRRLRTRACERAVAHRLGIAYLDSRVPSYYAFNFLGIPGPVPGLSADALTAALDELFAGVDHRKAYIEDGATGARLAPLFRDRGWRVDREVVMALRGARDRPAAPGLAREVARETLRAVEALTLAEDRHVAEEDPEVIPQLLLGRDLFAQAAQAARFFVGSHDGVDASTATLFLDDGVAQVEDVATLAPHRGRGLARATVSAAIDSALAEGARLVFLHADADDWPQELYAKLGFEAVGEAWGFTLPGAAA